MSVESDLRDICIAYAPLKNLVEDSIYPVKLPQGNCYFPAIAYKRISSPPVNAMGGGTGTIRARFQFSIYSPTYLTATEIMKALKDALHWYKGTKTVEIEHVEFQDAIDDEDDQDKSELYFIPVDFLVVYREI